jgi:glycosyltransferase involved in cell wall biosynthesis
LKALNLNKKIFINHQLVLFGGGKITNDEIKKILDLNLDPKNIIQLNGDDNLLKTLYQNSEFFIYPSKYEGFGIPILESFSQHCPVLCSNTSSFPEVAGNAAIYFDPNDYSSISECIDKIISSKKIKDYYIKKGLDRLKLFSWKKCAAETKNIYNNLF